MQIYRYRYTDIYVDMYLLFVIQLANGMVFYERSTTNLDYFVQKSLRSENHKEKNGEVY